jgi:hypothetical protein
MKKNIFIGFATVVFFVMGVLVLLEVQNLKNQQSNADATILELKDMIRGVKQRTSATEERMNLLDGAFDILLQNGKG